MNGMCDGVPWHLSYEKRELILLLLFLLLLLLMMNMLLVLELFVLVAFSVRCCDFFS